MELHQENNRFYIKNKRVEEDLVQINKNLSKKYIFKNGYKRSDFIFLFDKKLKSRYELIDFFLRVPKIRKAFNKFWLEITLLSPKYTYLLNTESAKYFMAELFFLNNVCEDTLSVTNLSGVEWFKYNAHKGDNSLYLKISPSSTPEDIKYFLSQNKLENAFKKFRNLPYIKTDIRKGKDDTEEVETIINNLNKLSATALSSISSALNHKEYSNKFLFESGTKKPNPRRKYDLISFILIHSFNKKEYSDGYIRSKISKTG